MIAVLTILISSVAFAAPRGIYVFPTPRSVRDGTYAIAMSQPNIDGVAIEVDWSDMTTAPGVYDFAGLDANMALAVNAAHPVELVIRAGRYVPAWVSAIYPLPLTYSHHSGTGSCEPVVEPQLWDSRYTNAFADMLNRVAAHLAETGQLSRVVAVKITGINGISEELRIPAETSASTGGVCPTDDIAIWQRAGYRPSLVVTAFRSILQGFNGAFPNAYLVLPIITGGAFPPIDETGTTLTGRAGNVVIRDLLDELVNIAAIGAPQRFILQHDSLSDALPADSTAVALANVNQVPLAWQTNLWESPNGYAAGCNTSLHTATRCTQAQFLTLLNSGVYPAGGSGASARGTFIEVFPPDVLAYPTVIATAHVELTNGVALADTYDPATKQLSIPAVSVGDATFSDLVVTVTDLVRGPTGTAAMGGEDSYDTASGHLTIPKVNVGASTYYNAVVAVGDLVSSGGVSGADTFNGKQLTIRYVQVGATIYHDVVLSVTPTTATVAAVNGGMPSALLDQYNAATGTLVVPAVQFGSKVYTNVIVNAGPSDVVSVGTTGSVLH